MDPSTRPASLKNLESKPSNPVLWGALASYAFDPPEATVRFEDKLSRENGWSRSFGRRAIEEYRRFLYLTAESRQPVSPSDVIDQVWHLHLLYTRDYWDRLCRDVLKRPLHHERGRGIESESFAGWYGDTLVRYRLEFGEPPADIWPAVQRSTLAYRRVDPERVWVLPRLSTLLRGIGFVIGMAALLSTGSGCEMLTEGGSSNPLNWSGPTFLFWFVVAWVISLGLALSARKFIRESQPNSGPITLDVYELAYLAGGSRRVFETLIAKLANDNAIRIHTAGRSLSRSGSREDGHPLERQALGRIGGRTPLARVESVVEGWSLKLAVDLENDGLLSRRSVLGLDQLVGGAIALLVPLVGVAKIAVGFSRGKPVGFLVLLTLIAGVVRPILAAMPRRRTRAGDAVISDLSAGDDPVRRVALSGIALLGMSEVSAFLLPPKAKTDGGTAGGSGSACGSGCGSAGGDGGGGGCGSGGGGCGGCSG